MVKTPKLRLRLLAAVWTAAVAGLLWAAYLTLLIYNWQDLDTSMLPATIGVGLATVTAAGISGFAVGWRLFERDKWHDAEGAIACGVSTAALAYPILCTIFGIAFFVWSFIRNIQAGAPWGVISIYDFGSIVFAGPLVGIWYTGWITLPVAAVAGYFLSRHYRK